MAGFVEYLQIIIDADAKGAVSGFGQSAAAAETSQKSLMGWARSTPVLVAGAVALGAGLMHAVKAYEEQNLAEIKLQNSLKNSPVIVNASTEAFLRQASAIQSKTAAADEEIISAQAMLGTFRMTRDEIMGLTPLVVDYARKFDIDLVDAAKQVGKAFDGQSGALRRNGVTIDENQFKTDRYAAITQALRSQVGGFAEREGQTFSGTLQRLQNNLNEIEEVIGGAVVPVISDLAQGMADAAGSAAGLTSKLGLGGGGLGSILGFVNNAFNPVMFGLHGFNAASELAQGNTQGFGHELVKSIPFIGAVADASGILGDGFGDLEGKIRAIIESNKNQADSHRKNSEEIQRTSTEIWSLIDAQLALSGSSLATERAIENYNKVQADGSASDLQRREASHQLETAIISQAKAAGDAAVAQLGPNASAKDQDIARTKAQTDTMMFLAASVSGPVKASLVQHVLDLANIPPDKKTDIQALINAGQVDWAEAVLNNLSRPRTASIGVNITGLGSAAAQKILGLAKGTDYWRGGLTWVGEEGPEIVDLPRGSRVIPNRESMALTNGSASPVTMSKSSSGPSIQLTVHAGMGTDGATVGRQIVDALRLYENRNGTGWRN